MIVGPECLNKIMPVLDWIALVALCITLMYLANVEQLSDLVEPLHSFLDIEVSGIDAVQFNLRFIDLIPFPSTQREIELPPNQIKMQHLLVLGVRVDGLASTD